MARAILTSEPWVRSFQAVKKSDGTPFADLTGVRLRGSIRLRRSTDVLIPLDTNDSTLLITDGPGCIYSPSVSLATMRTLEPVIIAGTKADLPTLFLLEVRREDTKKVIGRFGLKIEIGVTADV